MLTQKDKQVICELTGYHTVWNCAQRNVQLNQHPIGAAIVICATLVMWTSAISFITQTKPSANMMWTQQDNEVICALVGRHLCWCDCTDRCWGSRQEDRRNDWCCRCYRCGEEYEDDTEDDFFVFTEQLKEDYDAD